MFAHNPVQSILTFTCDQETTYLSSRAVGWGFSNVSYMKLYNMCSFTSEPLKVENFLEEEEM